MVDLSRFVQSLVTPDNLRLAKQFKPLLIYTLEPQKIIPPVLSVIWIASAMLKTATVL